jgi:Holliday junction resolvase
MKYNLLNHKGKRPNGSKEDTLNELIIFIKSEHEKGHLPSKRELQNKFHIRLDIGIEEIYKKAGLKYKLIANQDIKSEKAKILQEVILRNLDNLGFKLIESRSVRERGIDIIARRGNKRIGIELKAFNKSEKIKLKNINQAKRFIKNENLHEAIIISTADFTEKIELPGNIRLILYKDLIKKINNEKDLNDLNYIRNTSINFKTAKKEINKQKIIDYVSNKYIKENIKPTYIDILQDLQLDVYTYFGSLFDIYKTLKIPPPLKNMGGLKAKKPDKESIELWKDEFKKFILSEINEGRKYPTGDEINKHFKISHVWNIVRVSELYEELSLVPYPKRKRNL